MRARLARPLRPRRFRRSLRLALSPRHPRHLRHHRRQPDPRRLVPRHPAHSRRATSGTSPTSWTLPAPSLAAALSIFAGEPGKRIVCVANFRPAEGSPEPAPGHDRAFSATSPAPTCSSSAIRPSPPTSPPFAPKSRSCNSTAPSPTWVRATTSPAILRACSIGVLSSASEGLPLALLEYGKHGLAAVSTAVGQCPEVLDNGYAGVLVPASRPRISAHAIVGSAQQSRPARAVRRAFSEPGRRAVQSRRIMRADLRRL